MTRPLRIGSRASALARWQAEHIAAELGARAIPAEIVFLTTSGDRFADRALAAIGGKELFTKEIDQALAAGEVDLAVHSLKDVPAVRPAALFLAAVPSREDPRDAWVAPPGLTLDSALPAARIGTSSLRRRAQLLARFPQLQIVPLRGNVDTRLRKWREGHCDALVLAGAGLKRLGQEAVITAWLQPEEMCPAAGQGALAIECRAADVATRQALSALDHPPTHQAVRAERAVLARLGAGCQTPVGALAEWRGPELHLRAVVADGEGRRLITAAASASGDPRLLGVQVAEQLLSQGAAELLGPPIPAPEAP